jgi:predicted nucleic acid-binding Zn ribbon protein
MRWIACHGLHAMDCTPWNARGLLRRIAKSRAFCSGPARRSVNRKRRGGYMLGTILLIVLIILLIGAVPSWPYSRGWGYYPSGGLGLVLIVVIVLLAMGRI